ncbi:epidermal growth factor receptor kinase substrate 8-like protein 3 [Latimeria chalumnae]|uniref:epidermal growth factor receptor kinase substrate 8-like protein 3 n=1 Tax=Latimeria chalumnae TaxID=7897 RepID=UPI00313BDF32
MYKRANSMSRPSAKAIYHQRKEYTQSMSKLQNNIHYRVEHLFTCDLNSKDTRNVEDCIARLKVMDAKGRVWGQDMLLQLKENNLQLADIETKEELDSFPIDMIQECSTVLNSCVYDSILTITVQERSKRKTSVFLFQCEEVGVSRVTTGTLNRSKS